MPLIVNLLNFESLIQAKNISSTELTNKIFLIPYILIFIFSSLVLLFFYSLIPCIFFIVWSLVSFYSFIPCVFIFFVSSLVSFYTLLPCFFFVFFWSLVCWYPLSIVNRFPVSCSIVSNWSFVYCDPALESTLLYIVEYFVNI